MFSHAPAREAGPGVYGNTSLQRYLRNYPSSAVVRGSTGIRGTRRVRTGIPAQARRGHDLESVDSSSGIEGLKIQSVGSETKGLSGQRTNCTVGRSAFDTRCCGERACHVPRK